MTDLAKLLQDNKNKFENVLTLFMIHISCLFARNMVEILIYLSLNIEPHICFGENQYNSTNIKNITNNITNNIKNNSLNIWLNIKQTFYKSNDHMSYNMELKNNLKEQEKILPDMISLYDYNLQKYKNDIKKPINSAMKGSFLTNIFVQIQKIKVEISKLLILIK